MFDFLISNAWAAETQQGSLMSLLPLVILFVIFYFLLIRPQIKQAKQHKKLIAELGKGDEVATNGGLVGKIKEIGDNFILLEVATGTDVKVQRQAVVTIMPKGTLKNL